MPRLRVKICGVTRPEDAALAVELGADAVGMVFVPGSKRCLSDLGVVREIAATLVPMTAAVGLFFDQPARDVERVLQAVPDLLLQFQGEESPADCRSLGRPYLKGVRMAPDPAPARIISAHLESASAFVMDTYKPGTSGGTGEAFDWSRLGSLTSAMDKPWLLAGGIHVGNLQDARSQRPWGLDLASGIEKAPGIKDPERMRAFFDALTGPDRIQ